MIQKGYGEYMDKHYDGEQPRLRKTLLFIYNPMAGKEQIRNKLADIIQVFCEADFIVTLMATNRQNDAKNAVIEYGSRYDYVVCSGGDGTMNEVANGMMRLHEKPICGYIPAGTVNDFASSLRIPKIMRHATELVHLPRCPTQRRRNGRTCLEKPLIS